MSDRTLSLQSLFAIGAFAAALAATGCASTTRPRVAAAAAPPRAATGSLEWIGGPTAVLQFGNFRALTDPMLGPRGSNAFTLPKHPSTGVSDAPVARYVQPASVPLSDLDLILVSHMHNDHFDEIAKQRLPKATPVIVPPSGAAELAAAGFSDIRQLDWGQEVRFEKGDHQLIVRAVTTHHSHDPAIETLLGKGNGYVLEWRTAERTYRTYWTGDTVSTEDVRGIGKDFGPIDLMLPHLGGVGGDAPTGLRTMDAAEAITLVRDIQPRSVIPIHHTTFGHYREPIESFIERMQEAGYAERLTLPHAGERLALSP